MYADIILETKGNHRFPGYVKKYLGPWAFWIAIFTAIIQSLVVLTIYLTLARSFLDVLFSSNAELIKVLFFWIISSLGIFLSLSNLASIELWITFGIMAIIFFIFGLGFTELKTLNLNYFLPNWSLVFMPLGPILFALSGRVAIPALVDYFRDLKLSTLSDLKRAIEWGTILPAIIYAGFVFGIASLSPAITVDAISGLAGSVPYLALALVAVLGLLSLFSSYIVIGLDVVKTLSYDLKIPPAALKNSIVIGVPILIYLAGFKNFIQLISFAGGIFLSLESIFVIAMWLCLRHPKRLFLALLPILLFGTALFYEFLKLA